MRFLLELLKQSLFVGCVGWLGSVITYRVEQARLVSLLAGKTVRVADTGQPTRFAPDEGPGFAGSLLILGPYSSPYDLLQHGCRVEHPPRFLASDWLWNSSDGVWTLVLVRDDTVVLAAMFRGRFDPTGPDGVLTIDR